MGPRGSALICGYTNYHRMLEDALAELKKKEVKFWYVICDCDFFEVKFDLGFLGTTLVS